MWMIYVLVWTYLLFLGFLIYAATKHAWARLKIGIKILLAPVLAVFGIVDVLFNMVIGTILFLELPDTLTFSRRCSKHFYGDGWRSGIARVFSVPLNAIDPNHIG